ncbi:MAG: protein kinase, partial [Thermoguttaceae bacterium]
MAADKPDIHALFDEAVARDSAEERSRYLDEACRDDPGVRDRVESLLRAHSDAGGFFGGKSPTLQAEVRSVTERPGTIIGRYKLIEEIGDGGMGVVYMAEQQEPVRRKVALKIIKPGMDTREVIARFEAERQALALMDHPNIARVIDAGETASGRPHFVMELVKGVAITDYCDQNRLSTRERLALFAQVCQAVQHAHHKGIIHRDLKPSNVMVTLHDSVPVVKVIDFGIAKALGQQLTDKTLVTGYAQMVGTPLYMSPEQAGMSSLDVDTRSDIYSLGVLLYELLTGTPPFDEARLRAAGYDEMRRIIREEEPARPSTRLSTLGAEAATLSQRRQSDPRRLSLLLRGELDWIVMKALEKDRNRRYETASALAADVERYLHDEPVAACPPSAWYRLRKFARRNKTGLAVAGLILFFIMSAGIGVGWAVRDRAVRRAESLGRLQDGLGAARTLLADNQPALARQKLAEARGEIGSDRAALGSLAAQLEALEAELERRQRFFNLLDRAHEAEIVDGRWQPAQAVPFSLDALAQYDVLERDDWSTRLEQGLLGKDQVEEVRRLAYEQLVWLAADVLNRRQDQRSGQPLSPRAAAEAAGAYLQKAETARPPSHAFYRLRAQARQALGQEELARADVALAGKTPPTMACDYYLQGQTAYAARDRDKGIEAFEAALRLEPKHFFSLLRLGYCLCDLGRGPEDFTAAEMVFTGCIMMRPDYANAHRCRGLACAKLKQWDKALADFSKAIELDPKDANTWNSRGLAYNELKQGDKARADYSKAIELDPKYALAWNNRGWAYNGLKQFDKAL